MERIALQNLIDWNNNKRKKPLIVWGARQVGKTYLIKELFAKKYYKNGFGGMLVFGVKGGRKDAENFIRNLELIKQVTHIADVRSCVLHPASTTHRQLSDADLIAAGIKPTTVRLSLGIENIDDIIADFDQALKASC